MANTSLATDNYNAFPVPMAVIRKGELRDVGEAQKIADCYHKGTSFVRRAALEKSVADEALLIMETSYNIIIGYCSYEKVGAVSVIREIYLYPEFTRLGLGKKLINEIPRPILTKCPPNSYLNSFYKKIGFTLVNTMTQQKNSINIWKLHP